MHDPVPPDSPARRIGSWALIAAAVGVAAVSFGYVGGWLAPQRLTPARLVNQFQDNAGTFAGYRRNHAKGVCVTGKEMLGPTLGYGTSTGRSRVGSSPRCRMKTRFGVSAKIPCIAPHVHFSWPGSCDSGFGQSGTTSYGPV